MGNAPSLAEVRFGDPDVEPPVEVTRIGVDDLSTEFLGQSNAESGLADGGWTGNNHDAWARFLPLRLLLARVRLVVARCHGNYYDDIGGDAISWAARWTPFFEGISTACCVSSPNLSKW